MFLMVTNLEEVYHNYQLNDGLNISSIPREENPANSHHGHGFFFTTAEYINNYYAYGCNLRQVILPQDDINFRIVRVGNSFCANRIILGEKYSLYDPDTYERFGLHIEDNNQITKLASAEGNLEFLCKWKKLGITGHRSAARVDLASENGHVAILDFWFKTGKMFYSTKAIDAASRNGHVDVLAWWLKSGLKLKYTNLAVDWACAFGRTDILEWWKNSGLEIKYSDNAILWAYEFKQTAVQYWWLKSGLKQKAIDTVLENRREKLNKLLSYYIHE